MNEAGPQVPSIQYTDHPVRRWWEQRDHGPLPSLSMWRAILAVSITQAFYYALVYLNAHVVVWLSNAGVSFVVWEVVLFEFAASLGSLGLLLLCASRFGIWRVERLPRFDRRLAITTAIGGVLIAIAVFASAIAIDALFSYQKTPTAEVEPPAGHNAYVVVLAYLLRSVSVGPILEEASYRFFLLNGLRSRLPTLGASVISSLAFAAGHSLEGWRDLVILWWSGMIFCAGYLLSRSLCASMLGHALYNARAFFFF